MGLDEVAAPTFFSSYFYGDMILACDACLEKVTAADYLEDAAPLGVFIALLLVPTYFC
jgi:hypothetical protein